MSRVIGGRINDELYERLMSLGLSNTDLVRKALLFYLEHHEDNSAVNGCKQGVNKKNYDDKYKTDYSGDR